MLHIGKCVCLFQSQVASLILGESLLEGLVKLNALVTGVPRKTKVKEKTPSLWEVYKMWRYL